ncbi:MAG TPA: hypothetical protein DGK91_09890 [Clostridium sp.]|mgnify:CR=1 FL=1|jgi:hypothetical protein|nr:hypothetical protein [Clostridium sp.]
MKAGYIVGKVIQKKLKSWSQKSVINWLASKIGTAAAKKIVSKAVKVGASALATYLAAHVSWLGCLAGPIGGLAAGAIGWL